MDNKNSSCSTGRSCCGFPRSGWILMLLMAGVVAYATVFRSPAQNRSVATGERESLGAIVVRTLDGQTWSLADHKGKVVMVNYFATWCPPCRAETPDLVKIANDYAGKSFAALGISLDDAAASVTPFVAQHKIPYPIAMGKGDPQVAAGISAIPVTVLLDKQGREAERWTGAVDHATLKAAIDKLLAESAAGS